MSRKLFSALNAAIAAVLLAGMLPASAHHSLTAEFDTSHTVELSGTITSMRWSNPHAWLYIDVKDADGKVQSYQIEFGSPNQLWRRGWKKDDLPTGAVVKVKGYEPRDDSARISALDVTLPDGRTLFAGVSKEELK